MTNVYRVILAMVGCYGKRITIIFQIILHESLKYLLILFSQIILPEIGIKICYFKRSISMIILCMLEMV